MTTHPLSRSLCVSAALLLAGIASAQDAPATNSLGLPRGLSGFEDFHEPLGQPIYFESPFNDTGLRFLYLRHDFADGSPVMGGDVTIVALQARVALSERWQFIATKDGYSDINTGLLGSDAGWNDLAAGLKYVLHADRDTDTVVSTGLRYMFDNGDKDILMGGVDEWSPFVSVAKGFGDVHVLSNLTLRVPGDQDKGNTVGQWDVHVDYDVNPESDAVFAPLVEVHGVHYLDDGTTALPVGGLDYANLGTQPQDHFVAWASIGGRLEINHQFEVGLCYEFALTDADKDLMDQRVTFDFITRF